MQKIILCKKLYYAKKYIMQKNILLYKLSDIIKISSFIIFIISKLILIWIFNIMQKNYIMQKKYYAKNYIMQKIIYYANVKNLHNLSNNLNMFIKYY